MQRQFDFQAYVKRQKKPEEQDSILSLQNYAFSEDMRRLRQLYEYRAIKTLFSGIQKVWAWKERSNYLKTCEEITRGLLLETWIEACSRFRMARPRIFWRRGMRTSFELIDDEKSTIIAFHPNILQRSFEEAQFIIGQALGALQNGHVPCLTLLSLGAPLAQGLGGVIVNQLDTYLTRWQEAAQLTRDRAGLLFSNDMEGAIACICSEHLDWDATEAHEEALRFLRGDDIDWEKAMVAQRVLALSIFWQSTYFRNFSAKYAFNNDEIIWEKRPKRNYIRKPDSFSVRIVNAVRDLLPVSSFPNTRAKFEVVSQKSLQTMTEVDEYVLNVLNTRRIV